MGDEKPRKKEDKNKIVLRDHVYDGIEEFDQKLPNWWLFTFYIAIAFAIVYWFLYYQTSVFRTDEEGLNAKLAVIEEKLAIQRASFNPERLWSMASDVAVLERGKATFTTNCKVCHAADLSAHENGVKLPGVALNDDEWIHGGDPMSIMNIVNKGVLEKGMPPWEALGTEKVAEVTAYVLSYHKEP